MNIDFESIFIWAVGAIAAVCMALVSLHIYDEFASEKITLTKAEWVCSHSEKETHLRPQLVGKITVMVPYEIEVCKLYERKK